MCGRGLALDRPFLPSRVRGGAVGPRWRRGVPARLASPSAAVRTARGKSLFSEPRLSPARLLPAALSEGMWGRFL